MAKSLRSKTKRSWRAKKRDDSIYAATEAARLQRLNAKLRDTISKDVQGDAAMEPLEEEEEMPAEEVAEKNTLADGMALDSAAEESIPKKISTHGPRGSRREEWRKSKGMTPGPVSRGMNRQGGVAAKRKSGRSHRRR